MRASLTLVGIIVLVLSSMMIESAWADSSIPFVTQWGTYGLQTTGKFAYPQGIATDAAGNVYVTDLGNRRVQEFSNAGNFLTTWGMKGSGNGTFQEPEGIAIGGGSIYVVDNDLSIVEKFDTSGHFIKQWGAKGNDNGQFLLPQGVGVDSKGNVYVVDTGNSRIEKFNENGTYLLSIGSSGLGQGQFLSPHGIAIDSFDNVYVTDTGNNRVEKFAQDGTYLQTYGDGQGLKSPIGISVDKSGNIFVADDGNNRVVEFGTNGNVSNWGSSGTGPDFFMEPRDVTVDSIGNVFVVDSDNNRIEKFGSANSPAQIPTQTQTTANQTQAAQNQNTQPVQNQNTQPVQNQNTVQSTNSSLITDPNEKTAPQITSPPDMTVEATGTLTPVSLGQATATDAVKVVSITNNAPSKFPIGVTMVTWTAMNAGGNTAKTIQKVTVVDTTAPTLTAPPNVTVQATSSDHNTVNLGLPSSYDAVGVESVTNDAPAYFPLGQTVVTWKAVDTSGNVATAQQTVIIQDTKPPTIKAPAAMTVNATGALTPVNIGQATATDNTGITSLTNDAPQQGFALGTTVVTWTATDAGGNTATATQTIVVVNHTPPKLTPPPNVTFEATSLDNNTVPIGNATATDFESIAITNNAPKSFPIGKTTVLWTAKDLSGNTVNATQIINVIDTTSPKLTPPADITFEATSVTDNVIPIGNATATDIEPVTITSNASKTFALGKTTILWTAKDTSGNTANATQVINVVDTTAPKITAPAAVTSIATSLDNNTASLGNATATDNVKVVSITNNASKTFPLGKTTILWVATDESGNKANATQTVDVVNTTPPKITAPAAVTFEATSLDNNTVPIGNATATDIEPVTITSNASKTFALGKTTIEWTAIDKSGNKANATQIINVIDTTAPKITAPHTVIINATSSTSNTVSIGNATAIDNTKVVSITNDAPAVYPFGNTTVTWVAKDQAGNMATATQLVEVVDHTPPQLTIPSNIVLNATAFETPVSIGQATATGIIDTSPKITNNSTGTFSIGKTTIEWTATDKFGNTKTLDQTVNVLACGKPESLYNVIMGTNNNDTLTGSPVSNLILGLGGDDIIHAGPAGDCIIAGSGNNVIFGGSGNDMIIAGNGDNIIRGSTGNELIYVGTGSNIIQGGSGHNTCYLGNPSADTVVNCQAQKQ
ncbi:MAG TPA: HYR domain-containing protein [Candidatus Nitrosotalea sp.]|nr:HYR domain-containing protein [Candidatus Nitrosotalea sp.]